MSFYPVTKSFAEQIAEGLRRPIDSFYDARAGANWPRSPPCGELRSIRTDKLVIALESEVAAAVASAPLSIAAALTRAGSRSRSRGPTCRSNRSGASAAHAI